VIRGIDVGDIVIIPDRLMHACTSIPDHVTYLSVRVDPDQVLPTGSVNTDINGTESHLHALALCSETVSETSSLCHHITRRRGVWGHTPYDQKPNSGRDRSSASVIPRTWRARSRHSAM
jgi:hypothetical protein